MFDLSVPPPPVTVTAADSPPAPRRLLWGAIFAGVTAHIALPWTRTGVGWVLTGLVIAGVVLAAGRRASGVPGKAGVPGELGVPSMAGTHSGAGELDGTVTRWGFGLAALALLAVGAFRAAGWLTCMCVLAAPVFGSLAVTGGRSWRELSGGAVAVPGVAGVSVRWAAKSISSSRFGKAAAGRPWRGLLVGSALVVGFGFLFSSADAAFAAMVREATGFFSLSAFVDFLMVAPPGGGHRPRRRVSAFRSSARLAKEKIIHSG